MDEIVLCPVDHSEMSSEADSINTSYKCVECSGHLILINRVIESEFLPAGLKPASVDSFASIDCSLCKTEMHEYLYKDVLIDICPNCYVIWLDPNELIKILGLKPSADTNLVNEFDQQLANGVIEKPFFLPYPEDYSSEINKDNDGADASPIKKVSEKKRDKKSHVKIEYIDEAGYKITKQSSESFTSFKVESGTRIQSGSLNDFPNNVLSGDVEEFLLASIRKFRV